MIDIEEKYDLMKRDLEKAVKEADKLDEICYRLERENSDYHFENMKLEKQLAIAVEALETAHTYPSSTSLKEWCEQKIKQIKELDK